MSIHCPYVDTNKTLHGQTFIASWCLKFTAALLIAAHTKIGLCMIIDLYSVRSVTTANLKELFKLNTTGSHELISIFYWKGLKFIFETHPHWFFRVFMMKESQIVLPGPFPLCYLDRHSHNRWLTALHNTSFHTQWANMASAWFTCQASAYHGLKFSFLLSHPWMLGWLIKAGFFWWV